MCGAVKNNYKMYAFGHKFSRWQEFLMLHNYYKMLTRAPELLTMAR